LCDDVAVRGIRELIVTSTGCARARSGFALSVPDIGPHVDGKPAVLDAAVARAAQILARSRQPLISGLGTDVAGCRAALALAERCRAAVDHMHGEALTRNLRIMQQRGWIMTTFAEVKNRADCIVLIGSAATDRHPRFFERLALDRPTAAAFGGARRRHIALIGQAADRRAIRMQSGAAPEVLDCATTGIADRLTQLRLWLAGSPPAVHRDDRRAARSLEAIAGLVRAARYAVFVWSPAELGADLEAVVNQLSLLLSELNRRQRAAGLALGGDDGGMSALNACTWQTGFPLRVNFAAGEPQYDPLLNAQDRMLDAGAVDALLWISSFAALPPPEAARVPTIVLSRPARRLTNRTAVYIPVGTPGLDQRGNLLRSDSVVSLRLRALRPAVAPGVAEVLDRIRERL
jgi:formylmethanofuran dehydrogenase subunit B